MKRLMRKWGRWWRGWSTVVIAIVVSTLLALFGAIGAGRDQPLRGERYDRKQIIVRPAPPYGVRITEVVDIDFGRFMRHGYERLIPADGGKPSEVTASSTANGEVKVAEINDSPYFYGGRGSPDEYQIRVGSIDSLYRGHHRYTLSYTLPEVDLQTGSLALDVIGTDDEIPTDRLDIWLVGFDVGNAQCWTGAWRSTEGCAFERVPEGLFTRIDNLAVGDGVTFRIDGIRPDAGGDGIVSAEPGDQPPLADPVRGGVRFHWLTALAVLLAGLATIAVLFSIRFLLGVDRVAEGGPMAAAFPDGLDSTNTNGTTNSSPVPTPGSRWGARDTGKDEASSKIPVDMTTTRGLAELAPTEFAPPDGVHPWQAAILFNESVDDRSIKAWFSEMIARGALVPQMRQTGKTEPALRSLKAGDSKVLDTLSEFDRELIGSLVASSGVAYLNGPNKAVRDAWQRLINEQDRFARRSGWWRRRAPQFNAAPLRRVNWSVVSFVAVIYVILGWIGTRSFLGPLVPFGVLLSPLPMAIILVVAWIVWASASRVKEAPSRSALGSAIAIRVIGFRKFLLGSEGAHVDAAWDRSRIREYSAWAVALDAAEAWSSQIDTPDFVEPQFNMFAAVGEAISKLNIDISASSFDSSGYERANPWRATGRMIESAARQMGEADRSGGSHSWSSSSSGGGSSGGGGVGSGHGGGHSGSW